MKKRLRPQPRSHLFPGGDLILCHKSVYRISETHIELTVPETRDFEIDLAVIQALEDGNVIGTPQHVATVIAAAPVPPLLSLHQGLEWGSRPDRAAASP